MAQAATMGPPMSPREPRRSGRRSAPSASTSNSKSPDSDLPQRTKDMTHRPSLSSSNSNNRHKRPKQEDVDETVDDRKRASTPSNTSNGPAHTTSNGRTKRKLKDKEKQSSSTDTTTESLATPADDSTADGQEEEEQGITRCICGSTEDDPDAGEFMVQCETCKVWQHGLCMGYESEDQLHDDDYYCEQCRPMLHVELLKKLNKKPRQPSATSHGGAAPVSSRASRSHSPSHIIKQPSKRRNTMNSRDFDESLKEIMEATAAEAAAAQDQSNTLPQTNGASHVDTEEVVDNHVSSRKKRKRTEEDPTPKKRTRSASTASDRPLVTREETPAISTTKAPTPLSAPVTKSSARNKRGGRKGPAADPPLAEGEEAPVAKRQNNGRAKNSAAPKKPPASHAASHGGGPQEAGAKRNQATNASTGQHAGTSNAENSRAYKNSHAYVVSQQPLFTSWGLPDYLAHLEQMLPTNVPKPLEVSSGPGINGISSTGRGDSMERTVERGVKVKWPSKRMSVGDMNKRVRALLEWVGREQASASDRRRRRCELEKALEDEAKRAAEQQADDAALDADGDAPMIADRDHVANSSLQEKVADENHGDPNGPTTMKLMEELMEDLIRFQERFGPGAKSRDHRLAVGP
ncbi:hypothetical protein BDN72DRAFT_811009 [Pluteus cervinus]|uniref:Uncharacterized protein n=1 Tax=Pluteus cervinus TaxID=181527 RepID=A0ACD3BCK1_9AGAR|nr:hypothetical protein BDN72DRAFT_811009 [Pluteus cervinus]